MKTKNGMKLKTVTESSLLTERNQTLAKDLILISAKDFVEYIKNNTEPRLG